MTVKWRIFFSKIELKQGPYCVSFGDFVIFISFVRRLGKQRIQITQSVCIISRQHWCYDCRHHLHCIIRAVYCTYPCSSLANRSIALSCPIGSGAVIIHYVQYKRFRNARSLRILVCKHLEKDSGARFSSFSFLPRKSAAESNYPPFSLIHKRAVAPSMFFRRNILLLKPVSVDNPIRFIVHSACNFRKIS